MAIGCEQKETWGQRKKRDVGDMDYMVIDRMEFGYATVMDGIIFLLAPKINMEAI
jgi:hypothetical protein